MFLGIACRLGKLRRIPLLDGRASRASAAEAEQTPQVACSRATLL